MTAGYVRLAQTGELARRAAQATERMRQCDLCPRRCGVDRFAGELGVCRAPAALKIASDNLHFGEEPPITGTGGSGTVFLSHCTLRCHYCQNWPISHLGNGVTVTPAELAEKMVALQSRGAHNINFVTPSHYIGPILAALDAAVPLGLTVPVVWNCSGYEALDALALLDGVVDIYLPDAKHATADAARTCCATPDYPEVNRAALQEMWRQVGKLQCDEAGIAVRGLMVRHLVLPHDLAGSRAVLRWLHDELSPDVYVCVMSQYFPAHDARRHPQLARKLTADEYLAALEALEECAFTDGLTQEPPDDDET